MTTNAESARGTLCWFDIVLVVLAFACGLAVWSAARRFTRWSYQYDKPLKETFQQASKVPLRRTELAMAQKELEMVEAKLLNEQMEADGLIAEIGAHTTNIEDKPKAKQNSKSSEAVGEQRIKLDAANAMIRTLKLEAAQEMEAVVQAGSAAFDAQHAAEVAYSRSAQRFEFTNRIRTIILGCLGWLVVLGFVWFGCGLARKRVGVGHRTFVLVTCILCLTALCGYELLK
jgi:hypothetical protein